VGTHRYNSQKLRKILANRGRPDLADLLKYSMSFLEESSTYGSRRFSTLSTLHIKYPIYVQEDINKLTEKDRDDIFQSLLLIYPLLDNSPEITNIEYYTNFELDTTELVETKELSRIDFEHIHEQIKKCNSKIADKDYGGAITNARTLI